ncbi:hypothetical protein [Asticcacaulis taihuensis]|uniref:sulfotransferase family protein n=1 Tax=Asticcacaulis taihuensis TaxID=260084 RepID=UPI0026ECE458|nr:hypothetical protein [Asticcacaulis taihuensis]
MGELRVGSSTKKLLFVLGMHRSGTSALTGVLAKLGAELPRALMAEHEINPKGFFESTVVMGVNNELLAAHGSSWRDFRPLTIEPTNSVKGRISEALKNEYSDSAFVVLKDPRICRMVPAWDAAATELGYVTSYVLPYRHPLEVAKSLEKRDSMPIAEGLLLWLRHVLEAEYMTRDKNRAFVSMVDLLEDWKGAVTRISRRAHIEWPCSPDSIASEIDSFLDKDLRHQIDTGPGPDIDPLLTGWIMETFSALQELDAGSGSVPRLDDIRHELDEACRLFGPALHGRIERAGVLERGYNAKNQALAELQVKSDKMLLDHATQSGILQAAQDDKKALIQQLQEMTVDVARLTLEREKLEQQHTRDARNTGELTAEVSRLTSERDQILAHNHLLEAQYVSDMQARMETIHQLQQEILAATTEKARLLTECDKAVADLRLAEEKHRTETRKTKRNLSAMMERMEAKVSTAVAEAARMAGERDQLSQQLSETHRAHEARLLQMHDAQFAAAETIGALKADITRIEQAARQSVSARVNEIDNLNKRLLEIQAQIDKQGQLLGRYTGARRIDFLDWAFRKSQRPRAPG